MVVNPARMAILTSGTNAAEERIAAMLASRYAVDAAAIRSRSRSSAVNALIVATPSRLAASAPDSAATVARTRAYNGSRRRWKTSDPTTMSGMGRKASTSSCQEAAANTAPTSTMLSAVWRMAGAPTSRKRSSWLTSSLRVAMSPPDVRSSKYASSSCWMCP